MSKKIIAISLALLIMVVGFVGCGKKDTVNINGKDYYVMTDEDGEAVINDKNQAVGLVTDESGEIVTYEDGEPQTYYIKIFDSYEQNEYAYGEHYKLPLLKGWSIGAGDRITKDGTDGKTYIELAKIKEFKTVDGEKETFNDYITEVDANNKQIADAFENEETMDKLIEGNPGLAAYKGGKIELGETVTMIKGRQYTVRTFEITDASGKSVHYAENYYFVDEDVLYKMSYVSQENVEKMEFRAYLDDFVFIP